MPGHFHQHGYVVMSTDYRRSRFGDDETGDVIAAYEKLAGYRFVGAGQIGVIGGKKLIDALAARGVPAECCEHAGMGHGFYWGARGAGRPTLSRTSGSASAAHR